MCAVLCSDKDWLDGSRLGIVGIKVHVINLTSHAKNNKRQLWHQ